MIVVASTGSKAALHSSLLSATLVLLLTRYTSSAVPSISYYLYLGLEPFSARVSSHLMYSLVQVAALVLGFSPLAAHAAGYSLAQSYQGSSL